MQSKWGRTDVGRALLFERLVDEDIFRTHEATPLRDHDLPALRASVFREVSRILGTRCPVPGDTALSRERTVIDYGLPDLELGGRAIVPEDRRRLARLIRQTIEAYEPRLEGVEVEVMMTEEDTGRLVVAVDAILVTESVREPCSFSMPLGGTSREDTNVG